MWDLPGPGLEPVSPALAGRFLTTAPPGKPYTDFFLKTLINVRISRRKKTYCGRFLAVILNVDAILRGRGTMKKHPNNRDCGEFP